MLTVSYEHKGEAKTACFEVSAAGRLVEVKCGRRRKPKGLGELAKAVTTAVGIKPCGGCRRRAAQLDAATPGWLARLLARIWRP